MIRHLVWLADAQDPLPAVLPPDESTDVFSCRIMRDVESLPYVELEIANPGWGLYAPGAQRSLAVVESVDGTAATATVLARGTVRLPPSDLDVDVVTLHVECYPEHVDQAKEVLAQRTLDADSLVPTEYNAGATLAATDATSRGSPAFDGLFGRTEHLRDSLLAGRTDYFHVDEVTHELTLKGLYTPRRTVNLGDAFDPGTFKLAPGSDGPARQLVMRVSANLSSSANVSVDLSYLFNLEGITSLSEVGGAGKKDSVNYQITPGWTLSSPVSTVVMFESNLISTGRVWQATYRTIEYVSTTVNGTKTTNTRYGSYFTVNHAEYVKVAIYRPIYSSAIARASITQARRETVTLTLDCPVQDVVGIKPYVELPAITLGDLYGAQAFAGGVERVPAWAPHTAYSEAAQNQVSWEGDRYQIAFGAGDFVSDDEFDFAQWNKLSEDTVPVYQDGTVYAKDDEVLFGGRIYKSAVDGLSGFWLLQNNGTIYSYTTVRDPRWIDVGVDIPLPDRSAMSFFDRVRGQAAIAHGYLVMRKEGLRRMWSWRATFRCRRIDYPDARLGDRVRILVPDRRGLPLRQAWGLAIRVEEEISGDDGDTVAITLAIPLGNGAAGAARPARINSLGGDRYFGTGYLTPSTPWRTAGPDIEWTYTADTLPVLVDTQQLSLPTYACREIEVTGNADRQIAEIQAAAAGYLQPTSAVSGVALKITMQDLRTERLLERAYLAHGTLLAGDRGIDFGA